MEKKYFSVIYGKNYYSVIYGKVVEIKFHNKNKFLQPEI